MFFTC